MKWWPALFILAVCAVVCLLYRRGMGVSKIITAILYVFRPQKDSDKVTLDSCTGWASHVGRFCESRVYEFAFDGQLSKGEADVILLDEKKRQLLKLNRQSPAGRVELDGKNRYYLRLY